MNRRAGRRRRLALTWIGVLSLAWLAFAAYLDWRFGRFPSVLLGAVKILAAICLVVLVAYLGGAGLNRAWRRLTR